MKYVKQFGIILLISFLGEALNAVLPFPIPGSIYGMVLLLIGLMLHWIPLSAVHETGNFLIELMPLMFIPAGVGLMTSFSVLRPVCIPVLVITFVSTVLVMAACGRITQFSIRHRRQHENRLDKGEEQL
ncbi:MAG: CidA/LrgA family protein [Lachnospiraceae bacterium]|nr:CidA/LrgA family protein [Lachnospiraceae bacterium]